MIHALLVI